MSLRPSTPEILARARADLRLGLAIVLTGGGQAMLCAAVEELTAPALPPCALKGQPELALTARRAETLKAIPYDNDLARLRVPADADLRWLRAVADPADDLNVPMKGPLVALRDGPATLHRTAIALAKSAQLLPAMLLVPVTRWPRTGCSQQPDPARQHRLRRP